MAGALSRSSAVAALLVLALPCFGAIDPTQGCRNEVLSKAPSIKSFLGTKIRLSDKSKSYFYDIGVCASVGSATGDNVGVKQTNSTTPSKNWVVGRLNGSHVIARRDYVELEYFHGDTYGSHCQKSRRTARIIFVCDPCKDRGQPSVVEELTTKMKDSDNSHCFYMFEWPTSEVCYHSRLVICAKPGLSTGSIVVIVFFSLVLAYVLGGIIYKRFVLGAKGPEQLPHLYFWQHCGNLVADGCDFLCRSRGPSPVKYHLAGRGDDQLGAEESDDERDDNLLPM